MTLSSKVAVNPLPWILGRDTWDLSLATVTAAAAGISDAGFTAIHADVPDGTSVADYRALLSDHGLRPAPGYIAGEFDVAASELPALIDMARRRAGQQAELGLTEVFLASQLYPERIDVPAEGAGFEPGRLELVIERIAAVAEVITAEGVTPCFHPHVGSWIETEHEIRALLEAVDAAILSFGPDTGHMFWAGMDPAAVIASYAERVRAIHLKDVHHAAVQRARAQHENYSGAAFTEHVWTEPGRGDVDFDAVFAALPRSYDGWFVVEVDVPDLPTKEESTAESARWILAQPTLGVG
ncbi:MAG TPA: sugar phosphate isomerase/epimerase family protein [Streptosporangiaceae bacterium]|nr:sugar phosphate isomerase/epimerase family protein [Streptosporangiaceae bacterium]